MTLRDVQEILNARILAGHDCLHRIVETACGADLMSDVLAFTKEKTLLLTGLTNIQVIRTAEVADLVAIVFVRGKCPPDAVIELAVSMDIPLLITNLPLFQSCGLLHQAGLSNDTRAAARVHDHGA
jgi:predicted transcriptional regulator